jgi:hypothetical protein
LYTERRRDDISSAETRDYATVRCTAVFATSMSSEVARNLPASRHVVNPVNTCAHELGVPR